VNNPQTRFIESASTITSNSERDRVEGRLIEAKGTNAAGGRVFRARVIAYGDSKNGRRYPEAVLSGAAGLYEGCRVYDRHRSEAELRSSTISGLVGSFRHVTSEADGLYAELHLLPSATHAAEALDASLAAQTEGLAPLVGISHDVLAHWRPLTDSGRRIQEATQIVKVNSVDLVADPAAGGYATRAVAGGEEPEPQGPPVVTHDRSTARGRAVIAQEAAARNVPQASVEPLTAMLPEQFTEAQLAASIDAVMSAVRLAERTELAPTVGAVQVTEESRDRKIRALDALLSINGTGGGYRSFREAFVDITGRRPRSFDEDFSRTILAESLGGGYDSSQRSTESLDSSSWAQVLGDAVGRRVLAEYSQADLGSWRRIVSTISLGLDFRTQRRGRIGGYGLLPTVNQGAPYQPLPSPGDEEATYALTKRGGTEDLTMEMIANDDVDAIRRIPVKLGRSAAITLYRFIWDTFPNNPTMTYDSVALFHASHANTDSSATLSQTALSTARKRMRKQAAYGDSVDILSLIPRLLIVPPELEEQAWQICTSNVAIPATGNASDIPNLHRGLEPIVIDYYTDTNDWFLVADPKLAPTIELGFYANSTDPELFTQADPNSGSVFNADVMTWKLRHIYSGTVLDHRTFYRATA
jgi:hypothetical protein